MANGNRKFFTRLHPNVSVMYITNLYLILCQVFTNYVIRLSGQEDNITLMIVDTI